ncbi:cupin domain-containing protein [Acuticoccus mangrovi]|uniref:Cupin domain-containing protein n=1 Tax=Acuticoccus mangrovi TaxID=2796142 RepID=A0A934MC72_9HYPH|nr:cupin domain-containing protein [Acuticoccus mangrovi]MBJ3774957.1 cupin domain-containing protein [Acuticoccus mangrovi]
MEIKPADQEEGDEVGVGVRLREYRRRAGLRLKDVAGKAKCSESMLSKIENGLVSPSINTLHRITRSLGISIADLFAEPDHNAPFVLRAGRRPTLVRHPLRGGDGVSLESLTPFEIHGILQAQIHVVAPGGASDGLISHEGEELGYVLQGQIEIIVDDQHAVLGPGDSFFFASQRPHGYRNVGNEEVRIVWVNSPPTY